MQQFRFLVGAGVMNMAMPWFDACTPTGVMKQLILVLFNANGTSLATVGLAAVKGSLADCKARFA